MKAIQHLKAYNIFITKFINFIAEYNIYLDPEAAKIVFASEIPVVIVPLEVTHTVLVTHEVL